MTGNDVAKEGGKELVGGGEEGSVRDKGGSSGVERERRERERKMIAYKSSGPASRRIEREERNEKREI